MRRRNYCIRKVSIVLDPVIHPEFVPKHFRKSGLTEVVTYTTEREKLALPRRPTQVIVIHLPHLLTHGGYFKLGFEPEKSLSQRWHEPPCCPKPLSYLYQMEWHAYIPIIFNTLGPENKTDESDGI